MTTLGHEALLYDLNESDSECDDDAPPPALVVEAEPQVTPVVAVDAALPKKRRKSEWEKLTVPHVAHGFWEETRAYASRRSAKTVMVTETKAATSTRKKRKTPVQQPESESAAPPSAREPAKRVAWRVGDRCEAKYRAQSEGSAVTRWFPGKIEAVSEEKGLDVVFDDGDFEAHVPLRYVRMPRTKSKVLSTMTNTPRAKAKLGAEDATRQLPTEQVTVAARPDDAEMAANALMSLCSAVPSHCLSTR